MLTVIDIRRIMSGQIKLQDIKLDNCTRSEERIPDDELDFIESLEFDTSVSETDGDVICIGVITKGNCRSNYRATLS